MEGNSIELTSNHITKDKKEKELHDEVLKAESIFGVKFRGGKNETK